jgi:predicted DNA-binding transcriptional regulator AlpA
MKQKIDRYLRLPQIIGQREVTSEQAVAHRQAEKSPRSPRPYIEPIIPVSRAAWWAGVKTGKYPKPVKLGSRTTVWRESGVMELIYQFDEVC